MHKRISNSDFAYHVYYKMLAKTIIILMFFNKSDTLVFLVILPHYGNQIWIY